MIGTVEALGVFLLAILPGFVGLRVFGIGRPPLEHRGVLAELGITLTWSLVAWVALFLWRGDEVLPVLLDARVAIDRRVGTFAELVALAAAGGVALGVAARMSSAGVRLYVTQDNLKALMSAVRRGGVAGEMRSHVRQRVSQAIHARSAPSGAWDRLLARFHNRGETALCRVTTCDGLEVMGLLGDKGCADWGADGRDILLMPQVVRDRQGQLRALPSSRGVFVAGDRIAVLSVVALTTEALTWGHDD
jgi:hypothetical protein